MPQSSTDRKDEETGNVEPERRGDTLRIFTTSSAIHDGCSSTVVAPHKKCTLWRWSRFIFGQKASQHNPDNVGIWLEGAGVHESRVCITLKWGYLLLHFFHGLLLSCVTTSPSGGNTHAFRPSPQHFIYVWRGTVVVIGDGTRLGRTLLLLGSLQKKSWLLRNPRAVRIMATACRFSMYIIHTE